MRAPPPWRGSLRSARRADLGLRPGAGDRADLFLLDLRDPVAAGLGRLDVEVAVAVREALSDAHVVARYPNNLHLAVLDALEHVRVHSTAELADRRPEVQGDEVADRLRGSRRGGHGGEEGDDGDGGCEGDLH